MLLSVSASFLIYFSSIFSHNSIFSCYHLSLCHAEFPRFPQLCNSPIFRARMTHSTREHRRRGSQFVSVGLENGAIKHTSLFCQSLDVRNYYGLGQGILKGKYHCNIDLLIDWFGLVCFANKNKNCQ